MSGSTSGGNARNLRVLTNNLASAAFRKSFDQDPIKAIERLGLDPAGFNRAHLDALADLSAPELAVVAKLAGIERPTGVKGSGGSGSGDVNGGIFF